jgi:uncharacterized delta-60 repeat protein
MAIQADGRILVGGHFTNVGGQNRNQIARLDPTTGAADSFDPNANNIVLCLAVQADGMILAGGLFSGPNSIGGQTRNRIARLDPLTGLADSFDPNANDIVYSIAAQSDAKILVGGAFRGANAIGSQARSYLARLDAVTGLADSFDSQANGGVSAIALQPDGKILVGGSFSLIGGAPRNNMARLDPTTAHADGFDPNANGTVNSIAMQADGRILAAGNFRGANSIGGQTRNYFARLDGSSGLADSFDPGASGQVLSLAIQSDGKILVAGVFSRIGSQPRTLFARLSNDTAALRSLTATEDSIAWRRGGSSPQFTRVGFEYSTDNANYSFLGNGRRAGANWILRGASLPTGKNFFVRARGYYRTGDFNGSESIAESVRSVFLELDAPGPPLVAYPIATATPTPMVTPTVTRHLLPGRLSTIPQPVRE